MKTNELISLEYAVVIAVPREKVWETMLNPATYREWVDASWPGSYYEGKWSEGTEIKFLSGHGGTKAILEEVKQFQSVRARHTAIIAADGTEDRTSAEAQGWIGTIESYSFHEKDGETTVQVSIETSPDWKAMFDEGWPGALQKLKEICERRL